MCRLTVEDIINWIAETKDKAAIGRILRSAERHLHRLNHDDPLGSGVGSSDVSKPHPEFAKEEARMRQEGRSS